MSGRPIATDGPVPTAHRLPPRGAAFPTCRRESRCGLDLEERNNAQAIGATVACLLGGLLAGAPAAAGNADGHGSGPAVSLNRPVTADSSARLTGRAPGRNRGAADAPWTAPGATYAVRVRDGHYRTAVGRTGRDQQFRTRAGDRTSQARTVTARVTGRRLRPAAPQGQRHLLGLHLRRRLHRQDAQPHQVGAPDDLRDRRRAERLRLLRRRPVGRVRRGGTLNLSVRKHATALPCANGLPATPYRAGMVSTYHLFSQHTAASRPGSRPPRPPRRGCRRRGGSGRTTGTRSGSSCGR